MANRKCSECSQVLMFEKQTCSPCVTRLQDQNSYKWREFDTCKIDDIICPYCGEEQLSESETCSDCNAKFNLETHTVYTTTQW